MKDKKREDRNMSKISIRNLDLYYSDFKALKDVSLEIEENKITAFIGPRGRSCWTERIFLKTWTSTY